MKRFELLLQGVLVTLDCRMFVALITRVFVKKNKWKRVETTVGTGDHVTAGVCFPATSMNLVRAGLRRFSGDTVSGLNPPLQTEHPAPPTKDDIPRR